MKRISSFVGMVVILATMVFSQDARKPGSGLLEAALGKLPLYFVENRGICPGEVKYYVQGADKALFFTSKGVTFSLKGKDRAWTVKLDFVGANEVQPQGQCKQQAVFSYFKGPEKDWKAGLSTFSKVVYDDLWPGIDLVYRGTVNELKYEFVVAPGADPLKIRLRYRGVEKLELTESGSLRVKTPEGGFEDATPVAWQDAGGERVPVDMAYALGDGGGFGFDLGDYDRTRPLVLDPAVLVYCGYIGGVNGDVGQCLAVDAAGNTYVTGTTASVEITFPVTVGPDLTFNSDPAWNFDAFVAKVNAQGTALIYCGYIGGADNYTGWGGFDDGQGIAVDASGNAYVTGSTTSSETYFPVKVGPDLTYNGGPNDAFVAKVNAQGTALVYCGYIGGAVNDFGYGIAVDATGNVLVSGSTDSTEATFPVKVGPDLTHNGGPNDAFVAKVNVQGTALVYCGYIGGAGLDYGRSIAVDAPGNAYLTGNTDSTEATFPVKVGPDLTHNGGGGGDAYVAKVNPQGTALVYCGYIGGNGGMDGGLGIAVDAVGNAYLTGYTNSTEATFPVKVGPDLTYNGGLYDAFVAKVNAQGTALVYCGYIGGSGGLDYGCSIAVDAAGNAHVAGATDSTEQTFPVKVGPDLTHNGGSEDAFVAEVNALGTALVYCGYIGGNDKDSGYSIAVDTTGNVYVTGNTFSDEKTFPARVGPDLTYNGRTRNWLISGDAFLAKIAWRFLQGSGAPRPGGTVSLTLTATDGAALPYQFGSSLGTGPIKIDTRTINLSADNLLAASVTGLWPTVFSGYRGVIDNKGRAQASIHLPNIPALIGTRIHTAFVILDPAAPSGIKTISSTFSFTITK